jgi:hypothetical protein
MPPSAPTDSLLLLLDSEIPPRTNPNAHADRQRGKGQEGQVPDPAGRLTFWRAEDDQREPDKRDGRPAHQPLELLAPLAG